MEEEKWEWNQTSLPSDIVLEILDLLEFDDRWPSMSMIVQNTALQLSSIKGWRRLYVERHNEMAGKVTPVIKAVCHCSVFLSLEDVDYRKALADLHDMELGFKDVVMFLFSSKQNALLNLVGLHYLVLWLGVPANYVVEALGKSRISERQVCVRWWKLGRWLYGYRLRDESYTRQVSLVDLALAKDEEVLRVLQRGAVHEVLRVQISVPPITTCVPWTRRTALA